MVTCPHPPEAIADNGICTQCQGAEIERMRAESELRHRLICLHHADAMALWEALNELSLECFAGIGVMPPSIDGYNTAFAVIEKHRQTYSEEARRVCAGQAKSP